VAGAFVEYVTRLAEADRVAMYCKTTNEKNVPVWGRFGFKVIGQRTVEGITHWFMWRDPSEVARHVATASATRPSID
jgi:hypothetical protein